MAEQDVDERTVVTLPRGARVGVVIALLLLAGSGYLLFSPLQIYPADGFPLLCGTAVAPPTDELGVAACGNLNVIRQWQAGALAVAAAIVALGSVYAFGLQRTSEPLIGSDKQSASRDKDPNPRGGLTS